MKRKELKALAQKIVKQELIIQNSEDPYEIKQAQAKIMELSGSVSSMDDIIAIDELVQDLLNANA